MAAPVLQNSLFRGMKKRLQVSFSHLLFSTRTQVFSWAIATKLKDLISQVPSNITVFYPMRQKWQYHVELWGTLLKKAEADVMDNTISAFKAEREK